ncbi:MAG: MutS-related protein [Bacteroidales bacterium]
MSVNPETTYRQLHDQYAAAFNRLNTRIRQISMLRIGVFLTGLLGIYITANISGLWVIITTVVFLISFIAIVVKHSREHRRKEEIERLLGINQNELLALQGKYSQFDDGGEFVLSDHPFAEDLDVFGQGSVFQYLNRSATLIGKKRLAEWFLNPEQSVSLIRQRQRAVEDMRGDLGWRQDFQSAGMSTGESHENREEILNWLNQPAHFDKPVYKILMWVTPVVSLLMLILLIAGNISFQLFLLYMLLPLGFAFANSKRVMASHEQVSRKSGLIKKYSRLMKLIEQGDFSAEILKKLQNSLSSVHRSSKAVHELSKIIEAFDSRLNIFVWLFLNYFILWDIMQARRLERWRKTYSPHVPEWFSIISQFDALNSLACFAFNHPDYCFPEPVEKQFILKAESCGHPLIDPKVRVDNNIDFNGWKQFIIITGANMAGKSTYLRTVAVNFLVAMTGAPVCANQFTFSPASLFTSLRTKDNLLQSESYFFAELKRLKAIIDALENGQRLFVILDEILKGTNSKDKQSGSKALLRQLIRFTSSGMIATHDLSLGELIGEYPENIRNKRFEVEIENNELVFDYKLKEGISQNLNATFLMKKMGITI